MAKLPYHISGKLHVRGKSRFVGDEAPLSGMLYAKFFFSPVAHARIIKLDLEAAKAQPGVQAVLSASDITGENMIGHVIRDEPLFPETEIMYQHQALAMVLAEDESIAEAAASLITLEYEELPAILEIPEADAKGEWYIPERKIACGDAQKALSESLIPSKATAIAAVRNTSTWRASACAPFLMRMNRYICFAPHRAPWKCRK
ncbi:MAG: hypothetical protein LRZ88_09035 [Candidatus Cloacimonetes bacterium]|nr:hypothetical protein [Candidatus Cloacimonadota bacterium]